MASESDLIGTWNVTAVQAWTGAQERRPLGDVPVGYAVFDKGGRIFIQLSRSPSGMTPEAAAATFMCYFGTFNLSGDQLRLDLETGNNPDDVASSQTRTITLNGDRLTIGTPGHVQATLQRVPAKSVSPLMGAWRVQSFARYGQDGVPFEPLGRPPSGFAVFDATGRAFVQLGKASSAGAKEEVAKSLMAYFGPVSASGDTLQVAVESSNMKAYIGSTQTRKFKVEGDTLTIGTPGEYQAVAKRVA